MSHSSVVTMSQKHSLIKSPYFGPISADVRQQYVNLYKPGSESGSTCPICDSQLQTPIPAVEEINSSLAKVEAQLIAVHKESPHLQAHIIEIEQRIGEATNSLKEVQTELRNAISGDQNARAAQSQLILRARFLGRLSDFVEVTGPDDSASDVAEELAELKKLIVVVQSKLNTDETAAKMETVVNLIGNKMKAYSDHLDLEYSGSSLRIDLKKLTVVADTEDGPIPLQRMGSGENWVGYHFLTLLALHWWLRKRDRPVPGFLIFDQPTQAYYPPEIVEGGLEQIDKDSDKKAVQGLFELMKTACEEIKPNFQLIVLDHAHLRDTWFEDAIVEEWRGQKALVPYDWRAI